MAMASQESLHLHLESSIVSDNDTNTVFSTDLNETWDYEEPNMDINNTTTSKRPRTVSDSDISESDERISSKKHNFSGSTYKVNDFQNQNNQNFVVVHAESTNVNLSKTNPIFVAKIINELVGHVDKVVNTLNGLKIICRKSQANILCKEKKFGMYNCQFTIKSAPKQKIKGILHGISLDMDLEDIKEELENTNTIKIEQIYRLQKFDKIKRGKIDTETIIIEYGQEVAFPLHTHLGYRKITIKQFIPYPTRCFKCQRFGHVSKNCRSNVKCPICSGPHKFEDCDQKDTKKCCNCGQDHSAGYKGCAVFLKAKEIKEYSFNKKITYAEATKQIQSNTEQIQSNTNICNPAEQQKNVHPETNNDDQIVAKVIEKVQTQNKENEEAIVEKVVETIQNQTQQNEKQFIDQILEQVQSQASVYEEEMSDKITEKILSKTQTSCKCRLSPEAIFVFIFKAIKYFKDDNFLRKTSDNQLRHLAHVFKTCTLITLNHDKVYDLLHS